MKNILMLGTGGTIASEMTPDGLTPELTPQQLLRYVPAISSLCRVDCKSLFSLDSTNITLRTGSPSLRLCAIITRIMTVSSSATAQILWPIPPPR